MDSQENSEPRRKRAQVFIRTMEIDDLATVFHLGERLFTAREAPNLYRTWDEYEVINLFQADSEYCLVAESDDRIVGFALGTTVTKSHSAWKYGYLVWLGIDPDFHAQGIAPALHFFRKMGFGHPQEHIYLALNLDPQLRQYRGKRLNGRSGSRYRVNGDD